MGVELNAQTAGEVNRQNLEALAKNLQDPEALKAAAAEIAPLLKSVNVSVTKTPGGSVLVKASKKTVSTDVPELDEPLEYSKSVDLEALIALLQIENDEHQLEVSQNRIEVLKKGIDADHLSTLNSIDKAIDEAAEAEEAAKKQKRLGIFGMIIAAIVTVAVGFVTGGPAGGIAAIAVMGGLVALHASGASAAIAGGISSLLQEMGVPEEAADIVGKVVVGVADLVICAVAMGPAGAKAVKAIGKAVKKAAGGIKSLAKKGGKEVAEKGATTATKEGAQVVGKEGAQVAGKEGAQVAGKEGAQVAGKEGAKPAEKGAGEQAETEAKPAEKKDEVEMDDLDADGKKVDGKADGEIDGAKDAKPAEKDVEAAEEPVGDEKARNKQKTAEGTATIVQFGAIAGTETVNVVASTQTAEAQKEAEDASAAVKEAQAYLNEFSERLEDEKDILATIVQKMNDDMAALADILQSQSDVDISITQHIGG